VRWRIQSTMNLFDFSFCVIGDVLASEEPIYNVFPKLTQIIEEKGKNLGSDYTEVQPKVWVHKTANVSDRAILCAPIIVCAGAEIRPNAFLRGSVIVGEKAVVGAACEVKNSILFSGARVPHLSYVGDSILGAGAHFGAGVIASNLRLDQRNVFVAFDGERTDSGLRKLGALVGDGAQIGCNSVLCPGAVVEKYAIVKPLSCVVGTAFCNKEGDRT